MNQTKENRITPLERNNKVVMLAHFFNVLVIVLFTIPQVLSGDLSWGYMLVAVLLAFIPDVVSFISWKNDHETQVIKHLTAIGFAVFYVFILLTSSNYIIYIFCVPMMLAYSVYNDMRGSLMVSSGVVFFNILDVCIGAATGRSGYMGPEFAAAQIAMTTLFSVYCIFVAKTSDSNFSYVLSNLASVTNEMKSGIADIHEELVRLKDSSEATISAMQEVSIGSTDTAEAVQGQMMQTQEIQNKVEIVSGSAGSISERMQQTLSILDEGRQNVSVLVEKVDMSVQSGAMVEEKLRVLDESVGKMNTIVSFIGRIAKETTLLSYNAQVQASHAGEFGSGFAVIATEISDMAQQTEEATTSITDIIENTSSVITEVVSVIHDMIDGIKEEKHSTDSTADSFNTIQESTLSVRDNIELLSSNIRDLIEANNMIADSIQTVSAISEEVSAHATETTKAQEDNAAILSRIDLRMQSLLEVMNE